MPLYLLPHILAIAEVITQVFLVVLIADMIVGFVHWAEDNYGQTDWPLIGKSVIEPNLLHHAKPKAFCNNTWWQSADYQVMGSLAVLIVASICGLLSWQLIAILALAVNGNEVHKWSHRSRKENGRIISWLQDTGLVQSRRQHAHHHGGERNTHYCTLTEWVNPILERIKFWRGLEYLIKAATGVEARVDPDVLERRQRRERKAMKDFNSAYDFSHATTQLQMVAVSAA